MILKRTEIITLIKKLQQKTVVAPSKDFPFTVSCEAPGYESENAPLLAKLSIMMEMAECPDTD
jgi:hypothetical protein